MNEIEQVELVCAETNGLAVAGPIKAALVADLRPIADRLAGYADTAANVVVSNEAEANGYAEVLKAIDADIKTVKACEVLTKITDGLHKMHRKWTALRSLFTDPLLTSKQTIHDCVRDWQVEQADLAMERQRRLQAEADERARKEREKLEKQAAAYKTEERREAKLAEAAAVIAPTVTVSAPKAISTRKVWKVKNVDLDAFLAAATKDMNLRGFLTVELTKLERAKAANDSMTVPGVVFELRVT